MYCRFVLSFSVRCFPSLSDSFYFVYDALSMSIKFRVKYTYESTNTHARLVYLNGLQILFFSFVILMSSIIFTVLGRAIQHYLILSHWMILPLKIAMLWHRAWQLLLDTHKLWAYTILHTSTFLVLLTYLARN